LEEFAVAKRLPVEFLIACSVKQERWGLRITYLERDGQPAQQQRRRTALRAKDGSTWEKGAGSPIPYGRWRLDEAVEKGELWLVEGESDCWTAWFHNVPALGIPGADMAKTLAADDLRDIERAYIVRELDRGGATFIAAMTKRLGEVGWQGAAFVVTLPTKDLNDLHRRRGDRFAGSLISAKDTAAPLTLAPAATDAPTTTEPELRREGLDLALVWPDGVRFVLTTIRDGRDGVRGELTVTRGNRRLSWSSFALSSIHARDVLCRKLEATARGPAWADYLEEACWRLTQAARQGEPLVTLTGTPTSPTRELVPRLLYEGEPTLLYADGDTGKSLVALALAVAVHSGTALPFCLKPARAVPAAYLDWETSRDTLETRLALVAAGLGIDAPAILYKRMTRPLVDEAGVLAADFARRGIGFVVIDSKMFAVAGGEGSAFHEPITAFYNAIRLFAPAASLVLNHVTNADARTGGPARPFGGAFAFNGPRLIWEAKRDPDVTDATAIAFTCRKANNLPRRPDPFGLRFQPGDGAITIYPFNLTEASPNVVAGASLHWRIRVALAGGATTVAALAEELKAPPRASRRRSSAGATSTSF